MASSSILKTRLIDTPLAPMQAVADENHLYLLEFSEYHRLEKQTNQLKRLIKSEIALDTTPIIDTLEEELNAYFQGTLKQFKTPLFFSGTPFQKRTWEALLKIPYGETQSYAGIAASLHHPTAFRAVANANGANRLAIIIPCHRVINSNGKLGGYGGGINRKQWLLDHEKKHA